MSNQRALAAAKGERTYDNGKPCKQGHAPIRYTSGGTCVECLSIRTKAIYTATRPVAIQKARVRRARILADADLAREHVAVRRSLNRRYKKIPLPLYPEPTHCECCGGLPNGRYKRLHVDHCHLTGVFRGWLCFKCNAAIGMLGDTIQGPLNAVAYFQRKDPR